MKGPLGTGDALADDLGGFVDEDCHVPAPTLPLLAGFPPELRLWLVSRRKCPQSRSRRLALGMEMAVPLLKSLPQRTKLFDRFPERARVSKERNPVGLGQRGNSHPCKPGWDLFCTDWAIRLAPYRE